MLLASQKPADGYLTLATSQAVSLNTTQLGISLVFSLSVVIFLATVVKLHPFVSLLDAALVVGILNNAMTMMHAGSMATTLLIIVIIVGSIFLSHLNDAGFLLIKKALRPEYWRDHEDLIGSEMPAVGNGSGHDRQPL